MYGVDFSSSRDYQNKAYESCIRAKQTHYLSLSNNKTTIFYAGCIFTWTTSSTCIGLLSSLIGLWIISRLVGKLIYFVVTRPDLAYSVYILFQFMNVPREEHWTSVLIVVCYLKGSSRQGILLRDDCDLHLYGWCDSDFSSCTLTRQSSTKVITFIGKRKIRITFNLANLWSLGKRKQNIASLSSLCKIRIQSNVQNNSGINLA